MRCLPLSLALLVCVSGGFAARGAEAMRFAPLGSVTVEDAFWSPRFALWRDKTLPDVLTKMETRSHAVSNFVLAARGKGGRHHGAYFFDGLLYETIRGASDYLLRDPNPALEARIDALVDTIVSAQCADGYLHTGLQVKLKGEWRWGDNGGFALDQHEIYDAGCLIEAGLHYYRATGKTKLLHAGIRFANLLCRIMGPAPKRNLIPTHSLAEEALVKLAALAKEDSAVRALCAPASPKDYLALVRFWFDSHGRHCGAPDWRALGWKARGEAMRLSLTPHDVQWRPSYGDYQMDRVPLAEYRSIEGHAVRATLLCNGLAAYAVATGERDIAALAQRFWESMVGCKLYLSGGVGADAKFESFVADYELPPDAYLETCAAIGNAFFSGNMAALTAEGRYIDELERVLYNALLTAVGEDGTHYTYVNPLNTDKGERWDWHGCPCCPPMFLKLTGCLPAYAYATAPNGDVFVNLFMGSRVTLSTPRGKVALAQETRYPASGEIVLTVKPERPAAFALRVRLPGWARGIENPFGLYRSEGLRPVTLTLNGQPLVPTIEKGYAVLSRTWQPGDRVVLSLDCSLRTIRADERVKAVRGLVAAARGPLVMAVESIDDPAYASFDRAIPYAHVANRGACGHRVWIAPAKRK